jgi:hypothetical protein
MHVRMPNAQLPALEVVLVAWVRHRGQDLVVLRMSGRMDRLSVDLVCHPACLLERDPFYGRISKDLGCCF